MFLQVNKKPPIVVGGFFMVSAKRTTAQIPAGILATSPS